MSSTGSVLVQDIISRKKWNVEEARRSSSYRELRAIALSLESFLHLVKGHTIKWYTDKVFLEFQCFKYVYSLSTLTI